MADFVCANVTEDILKIAVSNEHEIPAESIKISDLKIKAGSKKGDGFACEIAAVDFNATFNNQTLEKNYIAKFASGGARSAMLKMMNAFEKEGKAYSWLIPQLQKLRADKNLKRLAFPKCFYASVENELIILENMKTQNFEVVVKKPEPLTLDAVKLVLQELAAFHATSYYYIKTHPDGLETLAKQHKFVFTEDHMGSGEFSEDMMEPFMDMTTKMVSICTMVVEKYGSQDLAKRMKDFLKTVKDVMGSYVGKKWKVSFITHGDAWYNNFLFRYGSGNREKPTDLSIVDLQNTRLARPGIELAYFICSSTSAEQRKIHYDDFLKLYYKSFFDELKSLGDNSKQPDFTFDELKQEVYDCYPFGFVMGCFHSQLLLVKEGSESNLDMESFGNKDATDKMMENFGTEVMAQVEASPGYKTHVLGLAEDAALRGII